MQQPNNGPPMRLLLNQGSDQQYIHQQQNFTDKVQLTLSGSVSNITVGSGRGERTLLTIERQPHEMNLQSSMNADSAASQSSVVMQHGNAGAVLPPQLQLQIQQQQTPQQPQQQIQLQHLQTQQIQQHQLGSTMLQNLHPQQQIQQHQLQHQIQHQMQPQQLPNQQQLIPQQAQQTTIPQSQAIQQQAVQQQAVQHQQAMLQRPPTMPQPIQQVHQSVQPQQQQQQIAQPQPMQQPVQHLHNVQPTNQILHLSQQQFQPIQPPLSSRSSIQVQMQRVVQNRPLIPQNVSRPPVISATANIVTSWKNPSPAPQSQVASGTTASFVQAGPTEVSNVRFMAAGDLAQNGGKMQAKPTSQFQSQFLQFANSGHTIAATGKGDGEKPVARKSAPKKPSKKAQAAALAAQAQAAATAASSSLTPPRPVSSMTLAGPNAPAKIILQSQTGVDTDGQGKSQQFLLLSLPTSGGALSGIPGKNYTFVPGGHNQLVRHSGSQEFVASQAEHIIQPASQQSALQVSEHQVQHIQHQQQQYQPSPHVLTPHSQAPPPVGIAAIIQQGSSGAPQMLSAPAPRYQVASQPPHFVKLQPTSGLFSQGGQITNPSPGTSDGRNFQVIQSQSEERPPSISQIQLATHMATSEVPPNEVPTSADAVSADVRISPAGPLAPPTSTSPILNQAQGQQQQQQAPQSTQSLLANVTKMPAVMARGGVAKSKKGSQEKDKFVLCPNCGTQSDDLNRCDSCRKVIPENIEIQTKKKTPKNKKADPDIQNDFSNRIKKAGMPKGLAASTGLQSTPLVGTAAQLLGVHPAPATLASSPSGKSDVAVPVKASKANSVSFDINEPHDPPLPEGQTKKNEKPKKGGLQRGGKGTRAPGASRQKPPKPEPEVVTISDSDEEEGKTDEANEQQPDGNEMQLPRFAKSGSDSRLGEFREEEMGEEEDQQFRMNCVNPQLSTPGFGSPPIRPISRVERMQMESLGKQLDVPKAANVIVKQGVKRKAPFDVMPPLPNAVSEESSVVEGVTQHILPTLKSLIVTFDCRKVQIGSLKGTPFEPVTLSIDGVKILMECEDKTIQLQIPLKDITKCFVHHGKKMPSLFFFTSNQAGESIRHSCGMTDPKNGPYYDPSSEREELRRVILLPQSFASEDQVNLEKLFDALTKDTNKRSAILAKIEFDVANRILSAASGLAAEPSPFSKNDNDMGLEDDAPAKTFNEPIKRLTTYPPHPRTGGISITNEDLFCLTEGEFLNDVIIDFRLKYIFYDILPPGDRDRTFIFSSFFYKRLTQKPRKGLLEDNASQTLQQRRHSRVKTWTRHVDLFSKDFIIIPINEASHWYLAIICFPYLSKEEYYTPEEKMHLQEQYKERIEVQRERIEIEKEKNRKKKMIENEWKKQKLSDLAAQNAAAAAAAAASANNATATNFADLPATTVSALASDAAAQPFVTASDSTPVTTPVNVSTGVASLGPTPTTAVGPEPIDSTTVTATILSSAPPTASNVAPSVPNAPLTCGNNPPLLGPLFSTAPVEYGGPTLSQNSVVTNAPSINSMPQSSTVPSSLFLTVQPIHKEGLTAKASDIDRPTLQQQHPLTLFPQQQLPLLQLNQIRQPQHRPDSELPGNESLPTVVEKVTDPTETHQLSGASMEGVVGQLDIASIPEAAARAVASRDEERIAPTTSQPEFVFQPLASSSFCSLVKPELSKGIFAQELEKLQPRSVENNRLQPSMSNEDMDDPIPSFESSSDDQLMRSDVAEMMPSDLDDSTSNVETAIESQTVTDDVPPAVDYGLSDVSLPALDTVSVDTIASLNAESTISSESISESNVTLNRVPNEDGGEIFDPDKLEESKSPASTDASKSSTSSGAAFQSDLHRARDAALPALVTETFPEVTGDAVEPLGAIDANAATSMDALAAALVADAAVETLTTGSAPNSPPRSFVAPEVDSASDSTLSYVDGRPNVSLDSSSERDEEPAEAVKQDVDEVSLDGINSRCATPNPDDCSLDESPSSVTTSSSFLLSAVDSSTSMFSTESSQEARPGKGFKRSKTATAVQPRNELPKRARGRPKRYIEDDGESSFTRKGNHGPPKPENIRGGGEEEEESRPNSSLSALPAVYSGQNLSEEFPQEITEEEVITEATSFTEDYAPVAPLSAYCEVDGDSQHPFLPDCVPATNSLTAVDDEFEGLQQGSAASVARASTIPQTQQPPQEQTQPQPQQQDPTPKLAVGPQQDVKLKQGQFAKSFEQFLESAPSSAGANPAYDDDDDDDDDDMDMEDDDSRFGLDKCEEDDEDEDEKRRREFLAENPPKKFKALFQTAADSQGDQPEPDTADKKENSGSLDVKPKDTDPALPEEEEEEEEEEDHSRPLPATIPATGFACKRKPCILIFDSLGGGSRAKVVNILRDYLEVEYHVKKKNEPPIDFKTCMKGNTPKVQQQDNFSDCGIYLLQYAESFFANPIMDFTFPMKQQLKYWFRKKAVKEKRSAIRETILELSQKEQERMELKPELQDIPPNT